MKRWCIRCGIEGTPEEACGFDEDGNPACAMHRLKTSVESAAPSPLPTTKKETAAMKFNDKTCVRCGDVFTPTGARSILCDTCNKKPKSEPKKTRKAIAYKLTVPKGGDPLPVPTSALEVPASEPCVTLHIPISRMNRLLLALL